MIVAGHHQHPAMRRGPVGVAVLERVPGAVDARSLAVPHRKHALDLAVGIGFDLLSAEHGRRGQILVDGGQELDAVFGNQRLGAPQFQVDAAERRAAIARHETGRVEARLPVAACLVDEHAHQRLRAGHEDAARGRGIAVVESVAVIVADGVVRGHGFLPGNSGKSVADLRWNFCSDCRYLRDEMKTSTGLLRN